MAEPGPAVARFTFERGEYRGTQLSLFPTCLVHRSDNHLETLPLGGVTAVRVSFERDTRKLGWGIGLVLAALFMLAIAGPVATFAGGAYPVRGRDTLLLDFADALSERLMLLKQ